ncbi:MAG: RluA family pseudouridine synthase [Pseudohongiellaceae bacterium]
MNNLQSVQFVSVTGEAGQRLDNFLFRRLKGVPKSRVYRLIRKGEVRVNKKRCKPDTKLEEGDEVRIPPVKISSPQAPPKPGSTLAGMLRQAVLYEGDDFLVLNKPAGFSVHGGSGVNLGLIEAMRQLEDRWSSLELAHRLDRDTSGCMIIAKNPQFLRRFHAELRSKRVTKRYLALVQGYWPAKLQEIDAPLVKNQLLSGERVVRSDKDGKPSLTRFRVVQRFGNRATLMEATPVTGRTHQIRVHCHIAGHPILGDPKYGIDRKTAGRDSVSGLCLHASEISFFWPTEEQQNKYSADLTESFNKAINALK